MEYKLGGREKDISNSKGNRQGAEAPAQESLKKKNFGPGGRG